MYLERGRIFLTTTSTKYYMFVAFTQVFDTTALSPLGWTFSP